MIFSFGALPALLGGGVSDVKMIIPFLATLALASQRITPAMHDFFNAITRLRASLPNMVSVLGFLELPEPQGMALGLPSQGISPEGINPRRTASGSRYSHISLRAAMPRARCTPPKPRPSASVIPC